MPATQVREVSAAQRLENVRYAIRDLACVADEVAKKGHKILPLNIGDPINFDFQTPAHLIEAVYKAMKDGKNGYAPSPGIKEALVPAATEEEGAQFRDRQAIERAGEVLIERALQRVADAIVDKAGPANLAKGGAEQCVPRVISDAVVARTADSDVALFECAGQRQRRSQLAGVHRSGEIRSRASQRAGTSDSPMIIIRRVTRGRDCASSGWRHWCRNCFRWAWSRRLLRLLRLLRLRASRAMG